MKLKRNLFFLFAITLFAIASTVLDIFNYNPFVSSSKIFINFYVSFLLALSGIICMGIFYIKMRLHRGEELNSFFWPSYRQSILMSAGVTMLLFLRGLKLLDAWVGIPMLVAVVLLELFFQTNKSKKAAKI